MDELDVRVATRLRAEGLGAKGTNEEGFVAMLDLVVRFQFFGASESTPALLTGDFPVHVGSLVPAEVADEFVVERERLLAMQTLVGLRQQMVFRVCDELLEVFGHSDVIAKQSFEIVLMGRQMIQQLRVGTELVQARTALFVVLHLIRWKFPAFPFVFCPEMFSQLFFVLERQRTLFAPEATVVPADVIL